jgi:hypothetical protein
VKKLERLGVGEGLGVPHRPTVDHFADRDLDILARARARDVGRLVDLRRHVSRRAVGADLRLDPPLQRLVEHDVVTQADEQHPRTSPCQSWPTQIASTTSRTCSTWRHVSAVPIRTPPGFRTASERP